MLKWGGQPLPLSDALMLDSMSDKYLLSSALSIFLGGKVGRREFLLASRSLAIIIIFKMYNDCTCTPQVQ